MSELLYSPVVRQVRLPVQVAEQIQGLILARELNVGDRLPPERDLCEQFKVSRTVVREAIRILEAKGLLVSQGGSGTYVRAIQSSDLAGSLEMYMVTQGQETAYTNLMEVRRVLEVQVAALAAERANTSDLAELERILTEMETELENPEAFARMDLEFHMALARATGNPLFELILDPFVEPLYEGRRMVSRIPGVAQEAVDLHRLVLERVQAGDGDGAAVAMAQHLEQTRRVTLQALVERARAQQ